MKAKPQISLVTLMAMVLLAVLLAGCEFYSDYAFSETPAYDAALTAGYVPELITGTRTPTAVWDVVTSPDIYTQADQAQATLMAANQQMTATQQSAALTQQAAAFEATRAADVMRATATAQAWQVTATFEAASATQAAQVQGTAQALVVMATQQAMGSTATQQTIDLERAQLTNDAWAVIPLVLIALIGGVAVGLGTWAAIEVVKASRNRRAVVTLPNGGALVVTERALSVLKTDVMLNAEQQMRQDANTPTSEQARLALAMQQQSTEVHRSYAENGGRLRSGSRGGVSNDEQPEAMRWPSVAVWPPSVTEGMALGAGMTGPVVASAESDPHLLVAGTTGSGKTRFMLRPMIAQALAAGWAVVVVDRSGLDFAVFEGQTNYHTVLYGANPEQAIGVLQATYAEVLRRLTKMVERRVSTWAQMPEGSGPQVMVVFDEFSNLADSLGNGDQERLWQAARMVAAEGRKAGLHLVLALQDPTHKSLDLRIRRNTSQVTFRVRDGSASRVVINQDGAERLLARQFLAVVGGRLQGGLAYAPTDADLLDYLEMRPVEQQRFDLSFDLLNAPPAGLESEIERIARVIAEAWQGGASKRKCATIAGGEYAGAFAAKIDRAIEMLGGATTATTRQFGSDVK